jgi:catechol 2,3-dioxygenase-like lactoylglutathione lyase family enzyme
VLTNRSAPHARIAPVLTVADVRAAVAWYGEVFGLVEHVRIGEGHRAQLGLVGGPPAELVLSEPRPGRRVPDDGRSHQIMLKVGDATATSHGVARRDRDALGSQVAYDGWASGRPARSSTPNHARAVVLLRRRVDRLPDPGGDEEGVRDEVGIGDVDVDSALPETSTAIYSRHSRRTVSSGDSPGSTCPRIRSQQSGYHRRCGCRYASRIRP